MVPAQPAAEPLAQSNAPSLRAPGSHFSHPINIVIRYNCIATLLMNAQPTHQTLRLPGAGRVSLSDPPLLHFSEAGRPRTPAWSRSIISSCWPSKACPTSEEPRIAYLAERLQIQHHSAVELVDRLVKKGLITRTRGEQRPARGACATHAAGERVLDELTRTRGPNCAPPRRAGCDAPQTHPPTADGPPAKRRALTEASRKAGRS